MSAQSPVALPGHTPLFSSCTIRILLVEDCESDVFLVRRMLDEISSDLPHEIASVPRLVDAFSKIDHEEFDLVMLDLNLLDIDGLASVIALKGQAPNLPIIVYSGLDDSKLKARALMCGAANYIVKGRETSRELKAIIERALQGKRA